MSQVWLTPRLSYNLDFERMTVRIASVGGLSIMVVHEKGVCKLEDEGIKVGDQGW